MKQVFSFLKPLKFRITVGMIIKIIGTVVELFIPFLLTYILEDVIGSMDIRKILFYGGLMVLCAIIAAVSNIVANRMAAKTAMLYTYELRRALFSKTLYLSAQKTSDFTIPSLETRITSDTYDIQSFVGMMQRIGVRAPILLIGGIIITLIMDKYLALVMIATLPVIFFVVYGISKKSVPMYSKVRDSADNMVRIVREDVQGIRVVKALSKNEFENARYDKANKKLQNDEIKAGTVMAIVNPSMTMLMNLGIVGVVATSAYLVNAGKSSPATVIAFMQYFTLISMAMMSLSRIFMMFTKCAASAKRIGAVLNCKNELDVIDEYNKESTTAEKINQNHIVFENVSFSYLGKKNNVSDLSLEVKKGMRIGIIGRAGSGKSTIMRLLMRFYDVDKGAIYINGKNIKAYKPHELTQMFGVVMQNDFLYADTIEENIDFGRNLSHEQIVRAAQIAQAEKFIEEKPEKYDYRISAGGTNLSGGQRQRILIARAIAANPEILILDDSSSALDYATDMNLRKMLEMQMPDSTIITVAQRVSSVKNCHIILVLDDGEIIGKGTHEELLENCEEYKEISNSQMGGAFVE